jgi:hypothetical protein
MTKYGLIVAAAVVHFVLAGQLFSQNEFGKYFKDETCRFDCVHTGTKGSEQISLDKITVEGAWPGSLSALIDTLNLGEYQFKLFDADQDREIYSRGYSTIFNEWQTTDEALRGSYRAFRESIRFPLPLKKARLELYRRTKRMEFEKIFTAVIDPASTEIIRDALLPKIPVTQIVYNGPPHEKVDIVLLGDGYTKKEMKKFLADARHYADQLFSTQPFKSRRQDFNIWAVSVPSDESGIDQPDKNLWHRTALGTSYNTFGSARYVLTMDNDAVRAYAAFAPYDFVCILVNTPRYGGGGIFQLYATCFTGTESKETAWFSDYVFVHEFGHCFGGLGDEYYTSDVPYTDFLPAGVEPWEPNVAAIVSREKLKWRDLVAATTPLPTEWEKKFYDSLSAAPRSFQKNAPDYNEKRKAAAAALTQFLDRHPLTNVVGAFEGAGYMSKGLYRPAVNCRMFSKSLIDFDPVCSRAINRMIDLYSK